MWISYMNTYIPSFLDFLPIYDGREEEAVFKEDYFHPRMNAYLW